MDLKTVSRRTLLGGALGVAAGLALPMPAQAAVLRRGIDYSWGRPLPSVIASLDFTFVCRYLSWNTTGKNLTRSEADSLRAAGLDIVSNWEYTTTEALGGYAEGVSNAREAHRQAVACGMPPSRPIYFSVDFDAQPSHQATVNAYFDGIASVIGRDRTGAYGGFYLLDRLFDASKITWGWQTFAWSGGNWDARAELRQVENNITVDGEDCDRNEAHFVDFGQWGGPSRGTASVYGVLADGGLTYTAIDAYTGERTHGAVVSDAALGFTPQALATLNFNTLLVTSTAGQLYRVDIITNNNSLVFNAPIHLGGGWTHDHLAYDGGGHLFGIADGVLRRYTVTGSKPTAITGNTLIGGGFTLKTLTTTGPNWIMGTVADGRLLSYHIRGAGEWGPAYELKDSTWQGMTHLMSPGGGVIYGRTSNGALHRYMDTDPYDGSGSDLHGQGTVDDSGWTQVLLSAQPRTVA